MKEFIFKEAKKAVITGDKEKAKEIATQAIEGGIPAGELLSDGFVPGITEIGALFEDEKIYLPELVMAADAMKAAAEICNQSIPKDEVTNRGTVILGTVKGDIHDIGKSIVESFLSANGFEVFDLGRDVPVDTFIDKAKEHNADVIATSALLTTTMGAQRDLEDKLKAAGLKDKYKTIIGGAPVNQGWADQIGADAYAEDAASAAQKIAEILGV
ncbi:MAG: methyltransferase cognate corrinoid protein [Desulfobacterales bacterium]|nr:methyltransferase cognate corrinoid protein [Desulfobacterales bacterium]